MAVVKSNAYGHGLETVVKALGDECDWFGVDSLSEAEAVREAGSEKPVLILGYTLLEDLPHVVERGFSQVCYSRRVLAKMADAGSPNRPAKAHIKVETGTSRQGVHVYDLPALLGYAKTLSDLVVEGASTHFANIEDTEDPSYAMEQLLHFKDAVKVMKSLQVEPDILHTACSAAAILYPETHFSLVRAGIALYGLWPSEQTRLAAQRGEVRVPLVPALTWKTRIAQVRRLSKDAPVSYGLTERVARDSDVAVIPVGYWDGFDRKLSSVGEILVRGRRAKVLGRVCMNMTVVDVTDIPGAAPEDEVVLIGRQGDEEITAEELADRFGTINYEAVTRINPMIPRILV